MNQVKVIRPLAPRCSATGASGENIHLGAVLRSVVRRDETIVHGAHIMRLSRDRPGAMMACKVADEH